MGQNTRKLAQGRAFYNGDADSQIQFFSEEPEIAPMETCRGINIVGDKNVGGTLSADQIGNGMYECKK